MDGGPYADSITIDMTDPTSSLTGHTRVFGFAGNDQITVTNLNTRTTSLDLDGQAGSDTYLVNFRGGVATNNLINVLDTGTVLQEINTLTINGTSGPDNLLLRASDKTYANGGIAFVAALHGSPVATTAERVNYNQSIASLTVNTGAGNDTVTLDDNWVPTTVNGGSGNDTFQIGQIFNTPRDAAHANTAAVPNDEFATTLTTRGYLSNGISFPTTINGGSGTDTFTVYHNTAALNLVGGSGSNTFTIRSFALEGLRTPTCSMRR